ncbi:MAG TPA: SDR family oxidoreductase [Steroidobacteraceae bacterium]|nr:SDR family oxidoreductase [Steroidobacteraceae bacterium]
MSLKRRDVLKLTGAAALAALANPVSAKAKPLRILILGGTGFIGPHFVEVLGAAGHKISLFNRGKRDPSVKPGIEQLLGDRNGPVDSLKGHDWDVVIDNSGYLPKHVKLAAEVLKGHIQHYIFISSISVYAEFKQADMDEDAKLATVDDPNTEVIDDKTYGGLKVLCEQAVREIYGKSATIIRPTYIAGPGDHTDRFTYWPWRVAKGGEMLAPGTPGDFFQFVDVRDLTDFVKLCVEKRIAGTYNTCNTPRSVTMGALLDTSKKVTGANTTFTWANAKFLEENEIIGEKAKGNYLPIWSPADGDDAGSQLVSNARAVKKGMKFRPLETTVRDTLAWVAARPDGRNEKLRAGLSPEQEKELLAKLHA